MEKKLRLASICAGALLGALTAHLARAESAHACKCAPPRSAWYLTLLDVESTKPAQDDFALWPANARLVYGNGWKFSIEARMSTPASIERLQVAR